MKNLKRETFSVPNGWPILLLGILITLVLSLYLRHKDRKQFLLQFEHETEQAMRRIQYRMERYESALIQARAFFHSSVIVSADEFHEYFQETQLMERFPGIQGMGLAIKVPKDKLKHYQVWPQGNRSEFFTILYLDPINERNNRAIGYDMFSEANRRETMIKARDSGQSAFTGKIELVQENEINPQPGLNLYVPYYKKNAPLNTIEGRRKNLIGFIFSPFRTYDLFNEIFKETNLNIDVEIFDGNDLDPKNLLYDYNLVPEYQNPHHKFRLIERMNLFGRTFTFHFVPTPLFIRQSQSLMPIITAIIGFLFTLLFCRIFWITKRQMEISKASEETLSTALKVRDDFFSIASHELKTPLTSLKLHTQMIQRGIKQNDPTVYSQERVNALIEQTDKQTQRLERVVDDMLDISRIKTGKLTIEKDFVNLSDLVSDVIARMTGQFQMIPGGAPRLKLSKDSEGFWDPIRIEQVITNLLTNALKYGNNKEIDVEVSSLPNEVFLSVKDYGRGISPEYKEKIFNSFERAGVSASEISGLGLGLYISKQIVKSHGGEIWVESEPGKGSLFRVKLPRKA